MSTRKLTSLTVGACLLLGLGTAAQASFLSTNITSGGNTYEDQSREAFFDVNGDGLFGVGDVLTGFIRVDDKTLGGNLGPLNNQVYAIFSQEVISVDAAGVVQFGGVTAGNGLSLSELGVVGAGATDTVAVFSATGGFSVDLINMSPGDQTGNGTVTLADYFSIILSQSDNGAGMADMIMGVSDGFPGSTCTGGTNDCFQGTSPFVGGSTAQFIGLPDSVTVANFLAGLEVSLDPAGWVVDDNTVSGAFVPPAALLALSELAISNGAVRGYANVVNSQEWVDGSELSGVSQCTDVNGANVICGFVDDADFSFSVSPERVPEPSTIALLGMGLLGMGAARRRQRRS